MTDDVSPDSGTQPYTPPQAPPSDEPAASGPSPYASAPYASAPYTSPPLTPPQPPPWPQPDWSSPPPPRRPRRRALMLGALFAAGGLAGFGVASGIAIAGSGGGTASVGLPGSFSTPNPGSSNNGSGGHGSAPSGPANASAIAQAIDPAVVDINGTLAGGGSVAGTGMVLSSSGVVLTNNHVIEGTSSLSLQVDGTGTTYSATVLGTDATDDIALLQMTGASHLATVPIGDSSAVAIGDSIVAIGNALGSGGTPAVTTGQVTALNQTITAGDSGAATETLSGMIQIDAFIQPGDSGGPLVNANGKVVGIDAAAQASGRFGNQGSNIGYAIPISSAMSIVHQIESGHGSSTVQIGTRGVLGVEVATTPQSGSGAGVSGVQPGSPAQGAGITAGDVITSVNGQPIADSNALSSAMTGRHPGDGVSIGWTDPSGGHHTATVQLEPGPPA